MVLHLFTSIWLHHALIFCFQEYMKIFQFYARDYPCNIALNNKIFSEQFMHRKGHVLRSKSSDVSFLRFCSH